MPVNSITSAWPAMGLQRAGSHQSLLLTCTQAGEVHLTLLPLHSKHVLPLPQLIKGAHESVASDRKRGIRSLGGIRVRE